MKFIVGKKIEMTQKFREDGTVVPVTLVKVDSCVVSQIKTMEKDGYTAVQIGCGEKKKETKSVSGHLKGLPIFSHIEEFRVGEEDLKKYNRGDKIEVSIFEPGEKITICGISKGRGFQGVVKRHGFHGHPTTHGTKDAVRMPGSIGAGGVQRVLKGMKMCGRMGCDRVTVKNIEVIEINKEKKIISLKGAVPGPRNGLVILTK
jgi:large subunit ribosomal protein L3